MSDLPKRLRIKADWLRGNIAILMCEAADEIEALDKQLEATEGVLKNVSRNLNAVRSYADDLQSQLDEARGLLHRVASLCDSHGDDGIKALDDACAWLEGNKE